MDTPRRWALFITMVFIVIPVASIFGEASSREEAKRLQEESQELWSKDHEKAIRMLDRAIELDPTSAEAYTRRAYGHWRIDDAQSIRDFTEAIRLTNERDSQLFFSRGDAYFRLGHYQLAVADFSRSLLLTPGDYSIYQSRAAAYHMLGLYELVISDYSRAMELGRHHRDKGYDRYEPWNDFFGRASAFEQLHQYDKALEDFTEALRTSLSPEITAMVYGARGRVFTLIPDYDQAIADLSESIGLVRTHSLKESLFPLASSYYFRGIAHKRKGLADKAVADFVEACRFGIVKACTE